MQKLKHLLPALALLALFSGCMKYEEYAVTTQGNGCKISSMYLYNFVTGAPLDTARFTWTGDNITRVTLNNYHYDINYNGTLIDRRTFYSGTGTQPFRYDQFVYDAAYLLARFERNEQDASGAFFRSDSTTFQYSGGFLRGFTQWIRNAPGDPLLLSRRKEFTYTGSNVSEIREIEFLNGTPVDTTNSAVVVNNDPNWFQAINPRFWVAGPYFAGDDMDAIEQLVMRNAVERETVAGIPVTYSYSLDAKGNLAEHKVNGQVAGRYFYNCP
ncbi:MAG: hypothetical protein EOO16_08160 [Chitinophagaceae bacterium]|nr:MAG: hypothetical protein EOO16_08160 [Chitinophagaceae bacterium]